MKQLDFKGKKVLITGGAGFIGSHLADFLLDRGDQVMLLDDLSTGRMSNIAHLAECPDAEFIHGSILDADLVDQMVSQVEIVYHLAAAVGVNLIVEKPLESLITNIRGTENVVEMAHELETLLFLLFLKIFVNVFHNFIVNFMNTQFP